MTPTGTVRIFSLPADSGPRAITASPTNNSLWFTAEAYPEVFQPNPIQIGRITVNGQRLADTEGQLLSGAGTGHPGTNFMALVRRATHRLTGKA